VERSWSERPYLKHLSSAYYWLSGNVALGNHHLLCHEHLTGGDLNTQITTSDHYTIGLPQDLIEVLHTLLILDFDDDFNVGTIGAEDLTDIDDILSAADERSEDHVDTILDTKSQIALVLLRKSREIDRGLRKIDTLVGRDDSVVHGTDVHIGPIDRRHQERQDTW